jgi:phosphomevalonate kinase
MAAVCETLATADDAAAFVEGIHRYGALLAELGRAAGIDIVPESAARIVDAASSRGGAAKPSGAGGGDLVVAAFPPGVDDRPFRDQVEALGGRFVPLSVAARGVHLERVVAAESVERGG